MIRVPREPYSARILKAKFITSLRVAVTAFGGLDDDGRLTVLLSIQQAFEMLIKATLESAKVHVCDKRTGEAISLKLAVRQRRQSSAIRLSDQEAGTICGIDALREAEQHWHVVVDEGISHLYVRAAVTLFGDLLARVSSERLVPHPPRRVLPVSAEPPRDLQMLVDREYERVTALLKPGRRAFAEAAARTRALRATKAMADPDVEEEREGDVRRFARGVQSGRNRESVFPKLNGLRTQLEGEGLTVEVRMVRSGASRRVHLGHRFGAHRHSDGGFGEEVPYELLRTCGEGRGLSERSPGSP